MDLEYLHQVVKQSLTTASQKAGITISPDSSYYGTIAHEVTAVLYPVPNIQGTPHYYPPLDHFFNTAFETNNDPAQKVVLDGQYLQWVPEEKHAVLPDVMVAPYTTEEELCQQLQAHGISEEFWKIWLNPIFHWRQL